MSVDSITATIERLTNPQTGNPCVDRWTQAQLASVRESLSRRDEKKLASRYRELGLDLPFSSIISKDDLIDALSVNRVTRERNELLLSIGERMFQEKGLSVSIFALQLLPQARQEVNELSITEIERLALKYLKQADYRRTFLNTTEPAKKELLALLLAKKRSEAFVIAYAIDRISEEDLSNVAAVAETPVMPTPSVRTDTTQFALGGGNNELDVDLSTATIRDLFPNSKNAEIDINEWLTLPVQPIAIPSPEQRLLTDPVTLAEFLWNNILYSAVFVDRNGKDVAMDEESHKMHIALIANFIRENRPIIASEYTPLIAIPNPLKRLTQSITLSEIDFFRRLASVAVAVKLYYPIGMEWEIINEVPAFQNEFGLEGGYVDSFHESALEIVNAINDTCGSRILHLSRMDEYLSGNLDSNDQWLQYRQKTSETMNEVLSSASHPDNDSLTAAIGTFIYPMATCISPYLFKLARTLSIAEIVAVYETLRRETGSVMRGVGMGNTTGHNELNVTQVELLQWLRQKGTSLAFNYRLTMGARDALPSFSGLNATLKYTMVTKRNKPVLYPNSRRGPSFPAHGEAILLLNDGGSPTVTVKPVTAILSNRNLYNNTPCISSITGDTLYFDSK